MSRNPTRVLHCLWLVQLTIVPSPLAVQYLVLGPWRRVSLRTRLTHHGGTGSWPENTPNVLLNHNTLTHTARHRQLTLQTGCQCVTLTHCRQIPNYIKLLTDTLTQALADDTEVGTPPAQTHPAQ